MARKGAVRVSITGDADDLGRATRQADRDLGRVDKSAKRMARGLATAAQIGGAALASGLVVEGRRLVVAYQDAEKSEARMRAQLAASGIAYRKHAAEIEKVIFRTSQLSALDDEDLQDAFTNIIRVAGDLDKSLRLVGLAADIARARQMDVAKSGELVAKVAGGNTGILARYGIVIRDGSTATEALAQLQQKFAGQAQRYGRTSAAASDRLAVAWENLEEKAGSALAPTVEKVAGALAGFIVEMDKGEGHGGKFAGTLGGIADGAKAVGNTIGPPLKSIAEFAAENPNVLKAAGALTALGVALKTLKGIGRLTGIADLLTLGRKGLGAGGGAAGGVVSKAAPVPVFVTNPGFGGPGGGTKVPPIVTGGGGGAAARGGMKLLRIGGGAGLPIFILTTAMTQNKDLPTTAADPDFRRRQRSTPSGAPPGAPGTIIGRSSADIRREIAQERDSAEAHKLNTAALKRQIDAVEYRLASSRRYVNRLKTEGASTRDLSRAEDVARDRAFELARMKLRLAEASGAARSRIERLRGEIEKLRSKRISVAVDINIPSLNVRAPGNLSGSGPVGPGARTGDGWGISAGIDAKVAGRVRAAGKRNPLAFISSALGIGRLGAGPGAVRAFDPLAAMFGLSLTSGFRPGAITSSGNVSYHAMNRAGDYAGGPGQMLAFAQFMAAMFGGRLRELIHTPLGFSIKNGQRVAPYAQSEHRDHVHAALARGGRVDRPSMIAAGEEAPRFPEFFISTNPRDRSRNIGLLGQAAGRLIGDGPGVKPSYARLIRGASRKYGIPANVLAGLIDVESGWDRWAVSPAGARWLTQFMPGTAAQYGVYGRGRGAVRSQIFGAANYLSDLGYGSDPRRALASYNAGPGNWQAGLSYAGDVLIAATDYRGVGRAGRRRRATARRRPTRRRNRATPRPPRRSFTGGQAREGFMGAFADQIAMREALAALTPGSEDDLAVAEDAARGWAAFLDLARKKGDQPAITTAAQNLKSARDAITSIRQEERDRLADAIAENTAVLKEANDLRARFIALTETQGPAILAGVIAAFEGTIGGRTGTGFKVPGTAGVPAAYR